MKFYGFGRTFLQSFVFPWKKEKKILGRWNLDSCHIKIDQKVDYSNHDHCGPCGLIQPVSTKIPPLMGQILEEKPKDSILKK